MHSRTVASAAAKCNVCGSRVDKRIVAGLLRKSEHGHKQSLVKQEKEFNKIVFRLKAEHSRRIKKLVQSYRSRSLRERLAAENLVRQQRIIFDQEFLRLKNAYQHGLAQIRQSHANQNGLVLDNLKTAVVTAIESEKGQFEDLAETTRLQLNEMHVWIRQELPAILLENIRTNSSEGDRNGMQLLLSEIATRDQQIQQAMERIKELEAKVASKNGRTLWKRVRRDSPSEPYKEDSPADPEQEILEIIREIAKERHRVNASDDNKPLNHFADSFGSRMSGKLSH